MAFHMQVVMLAAGRGTRMGTLTENIPKPMLGLLGRPMLEWKLEMLPGAIDEVILVVGYLGEQIENYFGAEWKGKKIHYVRQEKLDGTGGAITLVKDLLAGPALVMMGDDLYRSEDLEDLLQEDVAVLGLEVDDAELYGLLETDNDGRLYKITERPHQKKTGLVNTGAYVVSSRFFEYPLVPISETEYGLPQTLALLAKDIPVKVLRARAWQPVGKPEDIVLGEEFLKKYRNTF
ncbi:MAG: NTP transferase domain-containing protein [Candidatus Moranbacteria bacterium]|nr:NTP transferase domain-containing protein [Candidatus Moranbacteria bacterium]